MKLFKIYTEDKDQEVIEKILNVAFSGFTIIKTTGHYKHQKENALIIEILTDDVELVNAIVQQIKKHNEQESILITESEVNATRIRG